MREDFAMKIYVLKWRRKCISIEKNQLLIGCQFDNSEIKEYCFESSKKFQFNTMHIITIQEAADIRLVIFSTQCCMSMTLSSIILSLYLFFNFLFRFLFNISSLLCKTKKYISIQVQRRNYVLGKYFFKDILPLKMLCQKCVRILFYIIAHLFPCIILVNRPKNNIMHSYVCVFIFKGIRVQEFLIAPYFIFVPHDLYSNKTMRSFMTILSYCTHIIYLLIKCYCVLKKPSRLIYSPLQSSA